MDCILDIEDIRALLPHRYPLLLVDRVIEITPGKRIVGLKNVTIDEPFFNGHFPGQAVMPGVLILESMAQVATVMMLCLPEHQGELVLLARIDNARFLQPVIPGDTLVTEATVEWIRGPYGKVHLISQVAGNKVASCDMNFKFQERLASSRKSVYDKLNLAHLANGSEPGGPVDGSYQTGEVASDRVERENQGV